MQCKYEENPIFELYRNLKHEINWYKKFKNEHSLQTCYKELDGVLKLILLNNGCRIPEDENILQYQAEYDIIPDEYKLYVVYGMIGNDANEYYDFIIFNGMKILVIFLDYFDDMIDGNLDKNNPLYELKVSMGNSVYYDAIKKIVEIFYLTSEPTPAGVLTTAMSTTHRWNQAIVAIKILNDIKPIDEYDVSDIPMDDIDKILNSDIQLQLYGIRTM